MGMGVGMDFPTHEQQNEPKRVKMVKYWVSYDQNFELGVF